MIPRKYGKIINMASIIGLHAGDTYVANYAPSKAGVISLTKVVAKALGQYGINVNAIAPGVILTEILLYNRTQEEVEDYKARRRAVTALGEVGTVEDIANLALFLASDESSFITGQVIACDGGRKDKL
jgi:NAD(P)-dependent dehydrogenase (short-subunit alcohol dehydrogenase family)